MLRISRLKFWGMRGISCALTLIMLFEVGCLAPAYAQNEISKMIVTENGPLIGVNILGQVGQPGYYRVNSASRLTRILREAGGMLPNASQRNITITRGSRKQVLHVDLVLLNRRGNLDNDPFLFENDIVHVPLRDRVVQVTGPVRDAGQYEVTTEKNLQDLVLLAGGFTNGAAMFEPIKVVRFDPLNGDRQIINVKSDVKSLQAFEIQAGDVAVVPHLLTAKNEIPLNINRLPADTPSLSPFESRVFITGGVKNPQPAQFDPSYRLSNYITLSGGLEHRFGKKTVIVRSLSGKTFETNVSDGNLIINPGDTIEVKEKSIPTEFWIGFFATVASISLSAVAISRQ